MQKVPMRRSVVKTLAAMIFEIGTLLKINIPIDRFMTI